LLCLDQQLLDDVGRHLVEVGGGLLVGLDAEKVLAA
jgi:hypothetical protein